MSQNAGLDAGSVAYQASGSEQVTYPPSVSVSSTVMKIIRYLDECIRQSM